MALASLDHGVRVNEPADGARDIAQVATSVIGMICTADDADTTAFPANKATLWTDVRSALSKAGDTGTLAASLDAISDQASPTIVIVRVPTGANAAATATNVLGGSANGGYSGMQALLAAESQLSVRPRILGAPGLDTQEVAAGLATIAKKLRAMSYVAALGDTITDAIAYRQNFGTRETMLIWPDSSVGNGDIVARALGLRSAIDTATGWHKTLSNTEIGGVTGLSKDVHFDLQSSDNDAGLLNAAPITTIIRRDGFRFWGNRTCSSDPLFAFESATRTAQALMDSIADGLFWAVDKPLGTGLIRDMVESINADFRGLKSQGRIIDGTCWYDPANNTAEALAAGRLTLDYDYTPCPPAEAILLNQRITDKYLADFGTALSS